MAKYIQMSWFGNKEIKARVGGLDKGKGEICGQIIGHVYGMKLRSGEAPDGTPTENLVAMGDFEATRTIDNEVTKANSAFLPRYFAEELEAMLARNNGEAILFAVNVKLVSTDKSIPVAWEVVQIMDRPAESPMEAMKRALAAKGVLSASLPKPLPVPGQRPEALTGPVDAQAIPHDPETGEVVEAETDEAETGEAETKPANKRGAK